jgi:hypothetical protein
VIERLVALLSGREQDAQVLFDLRLPDVLVQAARAQAQLGGVLVLRPGGDDTFLHHPLHTIVEWDLPLTSHRRARRLKALDSPTCPGAAAGTSVQALPSNFRCGRGGVQHHRMQSTRPAAGDGGVRYDTRAGQ